MAGVVYWVQSEKGVIGTARTAGFSAVACGILERNIWHNPSLRADASIGPYKWGLGLQQEIYVPTRRGEGTHLQPKSRTCGSVGPRNAPAGAAPYGYFVGWQHVIKCSVGNGLDRSEPLEFKFILWAIQHASWNGQDRSLRIDLLCIMDNNTFPYP